jgi:hypothetical protein
MHLEILDKRQLEVFSKLEAFKNDFYLAGGTALALQLGHRKSIDFDLFSKNDLKIERIRKQLKSLKIPTDTVLVNNLEEFTFISGYIKITFLTYLYDIDQFIKQKSCIPLANELSIGAMKAYAIGKRSKWKDYVDLYFLFKKYGIRNIEEFSQNIYGPMFNDKLFREQLVFYEDVDFSEKVDFMPGFNASDAEIKAFLIENSRA